MSNRREHDLQRCLDTDIDFPVAEFIKLHSEVPQRTIRRRHAQLRATLMKRLQNRTAFGIQAATVASLNTPESQATKGSAGGKKNTAESQANKGKKNTAESQAAKGSSGGKENTAESQANKGKKNTAESQAAKGSCGGINNTPESQRNKGIVGGHGYTPEKQHMKASQHLSSGVVRTVSRELFRANPSSPSNISLKSVREYSLDGLDTLYTTFRCALLPVWSTPLGPNRWRTQVYSSTQYWRDTYTHFVWRATHRFGYKWDICVPQ